MKATDSPVKAAAETPPAPRQGVPLNPGPGLPRYPVFDTKGYAKSEPDADVRVVLGVDGVDEADQVRDRHHHEAVGPGAITEEAHSLEQAPVGDACRREDHVLAGGQVVREVDLLQARDPHLPEPLGV